MDITKNRFYVGTARGVLLYTGDKPNDLKVSKNDETTEVTAISEGRNIEEIVLGYHNGHAHIYDTEKCSFTKKIDSDLEGDESITGLGCIKNSIIFAKKDGIINIWTNKKNDYFSINLDEKGSLDAMVCHRNRDNIVGTGGEYNDFKLWDIETKQCVFKSKSLGHDELQLPIPTSVRGISFFSESNLAACCTKEGHVLLYDDRAQRRPIIKFLEKKASYTTISSAYRDRQVLVGTTKGYMQWLDLKTTKILKTYTTFAGSVTSIVCDSIGPYVASTSLDRHLRVHNMETKELVYKCYMKQSLTKLLVKPIIKDEQESENKTKVTDVEIDKEYEDLFENMEKIEENKIKKPKRKLRDMAEKKAIKKVKKKG